MSTTLEAIRPIELAEVQEARRRIAGTIVRTPLIRLELGPDYPDIRLKLENLQPINAYKLRGAANAVAMLSESERKRGAWTISAGNAGNGVAYAERQSSAPRAFVRQGISASVREFRAVVRRWCRRPERVPADVGADEAGRGRLPRC